MTEYEKRRETARDKAACIELYLEIYAADNDELDGINDYLTKLAKEAGLIKEFKQKGYIRKDKRDNGRKKTGCKN